MKIPISYELARRCHPAEVDALVAKLRRGKSKHREAPPEALEWTYNVGVWVSHVDADGLAVGNAAAMRALLPGVTASLLASRGQWWGVAPLGTVPDLVFETMVASYTRRDWST